MVLNLFLISLLVLDFQKISLSVQSIPEARPCAMQVKQSQIKNLVDQISLLSKNLYSVSYASSKGEVTLIFIFS